MVMAWATKTTLVEDIITDHRTTKIKRFFIMDHSSGCRIISESHGAKEPWVYVTWHWCSWRGYLVTLLAVISLQSPGTRDPVNDTSAQMHSLNLQWCNYFYLNILYVTGQLCKILVPTFLDMFILNMCTAVFYFLVAQMVKSPSASQDTWVLSLSPEDPLGEKNGNPLLYSYLEKSRDRGAW